MLLILTVLMVTGDSRADGDSKLRITQVESDLPDLRLFLQLDNVNMDDAKLKKNLSIKINDAPVQITDIQSVKKGDRVTENTAYLVLIDTLASMPNYSSEVQSILEGLFGFVSSQDKVAVFTVSNKLQPVKDFMSNDSSDKVTKTIQDALSLAGKTGTYLYSGIREAYDLEGRSRTFLPGGLLYLLPTAGWKETVLVVLT